mgnify:CR=1 FL=1
MNVQPTTTITIDDKVFSVSSMSNEIQEMVAYYDMWRQKEIEAASSLLMVRGAMRDLQSTMMTSIQTELAAKAAEVQKPAADSTPVPTKRGKRKAKDAQ